MLTMLVTCYLIVTFIPSDFNNGGNLMRFWLPIAVFFVSATTAMSQGSGLLDAYLGTGTSKSSAYSTEKLEVLIAKLGARDKKDDRLFLKDLFTLTHRQLLKTYTQYSDFGEIFQSGKYDCLTATALYSLILSQFGYSHKIIETNYHIFLLVQSDEGQMLIESTDPIAGFEHRKDRIKSRINTYVRDINGLTKEQAEYNFGSNLFREVTPVQLTGLLYYNQGIKAFNNQRWNEATRLLAAAKKIYDSPRIKEIEILVLNVIASSELEKSNINLPYPSAAGQIASRNK